MISSTNINFNKYTFIIFLAIMFSVLMGLLIGNSNYTAVFLFALIIIVILSPFFPKYLFFLFYLYPIIIIWIVKGFYRSESFEISIIGIINLSFIISSIIYSIIVSKKIKSIISEIPGFMYFILLVSFTLLVSPFYGNLFSYFKSWMKYLLLDVFIISYLYLITMNENNSIKYLKIILLLIIFLIILLNIANYISGEYITYIDRAGETFSRYSYQSEEVKFGSNTFGALISIFIPFLLCNILISKNTIQKIFFTILLILCIFLVIITSSRAPVLSVFISLIIFTYFTKIKNKILISIIIIFGIYYLFSYIEVFTIDALQSNSNLMGRIYKIWLPTLSQKVNIYSFIGHGIGSFSEFSKTLIGYYQSAHNIIVRFIYEIGIIGTFFYIMFFYKIFKYILISIKKISNYKHKLLVSSFLAGSISWWINAMSAEVYNILFRITVYIFLISSIFIIKSYNSENLKLEFSYGKN